MNFKLSFLLFTLLISSLLLTAETKIPDCLLSYKFGPEQHIVIVEKLSHNLFIYSNYNPEPLQRFSITTGKRNGQKFEEGDMKTPEGIYFFMRILPIEELPKGEDYGEKAFTLNYPNPIDKKEKRQGSGIWLHGAFDSTKTNSPNNSRGCVVMQNGDLVKVSKYIFLNQTPICIYDKIKFETVGNIEKRRDRLINYIKKWKTNWETKKIDEYIKYYDKDFSYNRMDLVRYKAYKNQLNQNYRFIKITLSNINLYGWDNYYVVMFHQLYISDKNHFYSKKIQYWNDLKDIGKIAAEYTAKLPPITQFEVSKGNYINIEQFRKDYLEQIRTDTINVVPHKITLSSISIFDTIIKLFIKKSGSPGNLKVIPVLHLENRDNSIYESLESISLEGGIPQDYSNAVPLKNKETMVVMKKENDFKLKSLTLFLINDKNKFEQIITYFVNK